MNSKPICDRAILALLLFLLSTLSPALQAQQLFFRIPDTKDSTKTILTGIITRSLLENDPAFGWMTSGYRSYSPAAKLVDLGRQQNGAHLMIFGGTWCEDTQFILPRFFRLADSCGITEKQLSVFAVNRDKQAAGGLSQAFNITNVPTIIVMHGGVEIGRVVEYGKTGNWDKELCELLERAH